MRHNFLQDILAALVNREESEEDIQAVMLIKPRYEFFEYEMSEIEEVFPEEDFGKCHPWSYVRDAFDYTYDKGYGSRDCHDILVYTTYTIYYIHEYDGATSIRWMPRNPIYIENHEVEKHSA